MAETKYQYIKIAEANEILDAVNMELAKSSTPLNPHYYVRDKTGYLEIKQREALEDIFGAEETDEHEAETAETDEDIDLTQYEKEIQEIVTKPCIFIIPIWTKEKNGNSVARFCLNTFMHVCRSKNDIKKFEKELRRYGDIITRLNDLNITAVKITDSYS